MLPVPLRFHASHQKLARARKHIAELRVEVAAYIATGPLELVWERIAWMPRLAGICSPDTELAGLVAHIRQPVPETLAPVIGDAVHNLRSALDIMMCEIVVQADPAVRIRNVNFPCWRDATGKSHALKISEVRRSGDAIVALVEAWQPFEGGASRLYALSELNNSLDA